MLTLAASQRRRRLGDPALEEQHGCPLRTLHAPFTAHGQTAAGMICQRQLERCCAQLGNPDAAAMGTLAERWGFAAAAHSSRVFKAAYGVRPRLYRHHLRAHAG